MTRRRGNRIPDDLWMCDVNGICVCERENASIAASLMSTKITQHSFL